MEKTLVLLKPDVVQRQIVGEIISRFEKVGLKIIGIKMIHPTEEFAEKHYYDIKERHGEIILNGLKAFLGMGPVIALVLKGSNSINQVRKMIGKTEPFSAKPGTIRGDYSNMTYSRADDPKSPIKSVYNLVHASANEKDAKYEIGLWFSDSELWEYKTVHELFI